MVCRCNKCSKYFGVDLPNIDIKNPLYFKCQCGNINEVNPFKNNDINIDIIPPIAQTNVTAIEIKDIIIPLEAVDLIPAKDFVHYLPYMNELYELGDEYVILDLLHIHNLADIDMVNSFEIFDIVYDNIHLGIIGIEFHKKDPNTAWISWTVVQNKFKSRGIGSVAVKILIEILQERGIKKLCVDSDLNPKQLGC